jgi:hypothetical protein
VVPSTGLDVVAKRRIPCPGQESNPGIPACSLVTILTELSRLRLISVYVSKINFRETSSNFFLGGGEHFSYPVLFLFLFSSHLPNRDIDHTNRV